MKAFLGPFVVLASLSLSQPVLADSIVGTVAFSDTSNANNGYTLTGQFQDPTFNIPLINGYVYTDPLTITASDADCHGGCNANQDNLDLTLSFTIPSAAGTSFNGSGALSVNTTTVNWSPNSRVINFGNGWSLLISVVDFDFSGVNLESVSGSENLTMQVVGPSAPAAATPEPSSLALLGTGILGAAGLLRRKLSL
jgi:hypothetical protein